MDVAMNHPSSRTPARRSKMKPYAYLTSHPCAFPYFLLINLQYVIQYIYDLVAHVPSKRKRILETETVTYWATKQFKESFIAISLGRIRITYLTAFNFTFIKVKPGRRRVGKEFVQRIASCSLISRGESLSSACMQLLTAIKRLVYIVSAFSLLRPTQIYRGKLDPNDG